MKSTHRTGSKESAGHDESLNRRHAKQRECDKYSKELQDIPNEGFRDVADAGKGIIHDSEEQNILVKKHKSSHMETTIESVGRGTL